MRTDSTITRLGAVAVALLLATAWLSAPAFAEGGPTTNPGSTASASEPLEPTGPVDDDAELNDLAPDKGEGDANGNDGGDHPDGDGTESGTGDGERGGDNESDDVDDPVDGDDAGDEDPDDEIPEDTDDDAVPPEAAAFEVKDAVLRWGINNEVNNRSMEGPMNFLSAGAVAKRTGETFISQRDWMATDGNVRLEKWNGTRYRLATWKGTSTDATGKEIGRSLERIYTDHQLVFTGGTGVVDRASGTASIRWDGAGSIILYGGRMIVHIADPELTITQRSATLTGDVGGWGSYQNDVDASYPVTPTRVTLADLPGLPANVLDQLGFTAQPAFDDVTIKVADETHRGSFPASFVKAMAGFDMAALWYTSGGALDHAKRPIPLTVSYSAGNPLAPPAPPKGKPQQSVKNTGKKPPKAPTPLAPPSPGAIPGPAALPVPAMAAPMASLTPLTAGPVGAADLLTESTPLRLVASVVPTTTGGVDPAWWLGGGLFVLAIGVIAFALATPRSPSGRHG